MDNEIYGLVEAAKYAGVTKMAISGWCKKHGIGRKVDGVWIINRTKLERVMIARRVLRLREKV